MAPSNEELIDRISDLPELLLLKILSLLPTPMVARTSIISRHFRHLRKASPVLDLRVCFPKGTQHFVSMAECALLRRDPSFPLHRLRLRVSWEYNISSSYFSSLLLKTSSLRVKHLRIDIPYPNMLDILPIILSVKTLESLRIDCWLNEKQFILSSEISLPLLKSLTLKLCWVESETINELVSRLPSVEELILEGKDMEAFNLSSDRLKKLKLIVQCDDILSDKYSYLRALRVRITMPELESLKFQSLMCMPSFTGEMPQLRKASITINYHTKNCVSSTFNLLESLTNVEELNLDI